MRFPLNVTKQTKIFVYLYLRAKYVCEEQCRAGNSQIRSLLISLKSNERLSAICSDLSRQMSDCEQIAQVAQRK